MIGGNIYSTGNAIVDENAKLNLSGNIIPQAWYKTIARDNGKPNLTAIVILADIVYWYRPVEVRDEVTGQVMEFKKKFKADLLQRSYHQISEQFGISKKEATNAVVFLEKLGVVRRVFRTINISGLVINNVLYLELCVSKLRELTYPEDVVSDIGSGTDQAGWMETDGNSLQGTKRGMQGSGSWAVTFQREREPLLEETPGDAVADGDGFCGGGLLDDERGTNTEITHKNPTKITQEIINREYESPILSYQSTEQYFKEQIEYDSIWIDRPSDRNLLENIVSIAVDVLTSTAETVRINREDKPTSVVQSVYGKLNKYSVEYVLDSITNCGSKVINIRAMIMTALYNATMTAAGHVANLFAYHSAAALT